MHCAARVFDSSFSALSFSRITCAIFILYFHQMVRRVWSRFIASWFSQRAANDVSGSETLAEH